MSHGVVRWLLFLFSVPVSAHMMSMSTGDAVVNGSHVEYVLRMPSYELPHTANPAGALFEHIRFTSAGQNASTVQRECHEDAAQASYICAAYYEFPAPVERLDVDCTLFAVTVPNHVHLLRAEKGGKRDQAIFDYTFTSAALRFRPPTAMETAVTQIGAGLIRALGGPIELLFLVALGLAARSWKELAALLVMFLAGQVAGALSGWRPPVRFVESAAALTVAYLAVEMVLLPRAGFRWLIAGVLGVFHGLYFALFLADSGYRAAYVLAGAAVADAVCVLATGALTLQWLRLSFSRIPALSRIPGAALFLCGMGWFVARLIS